MREVKYIVIHCSATKEGVNVSAATIDTWHKRRGWNGIGYHKVICRNGTIQNGRPEYWIGAHAKGVNQNSLGVCLIGRNKFSNIQNIIFCMFLSHSHFCFTRTFCCFRSN